jgi:hypothetical protein
MEEGESLTSISHADSIIITASLYPTKLTRKESPTLYFQTNLPFTSVITPLNELLLVRTVAPGNSIPVTASVTWPVTVAHCA